MKKILALVLALLMMFSIGIPVFAAADTTANQLIETQPTNINMFVGENKSLTIGVISNKQLSGQYAGETVQVRWIQSVGNSKIQVGTGTSYDLSSLPIGEYEFQAQVYVVGENYNSITAFSNYVTVKVREWETVPNDLITSQPSGHNVYEGETQTLSVGTIAESNLLGKFKDGTVSVKWFEKVDGGDTLLGTGTSLTFSKPAYGKYTVYCTVTATKDDNIISKKSNEVKVTVYKEVGSLIKVQPSDCEFFKGEEGQKLVIVPIDADDLVGTEYEGGTVSVEWRKKDTYGTLVHLCYENEYDISFCGLGTWTNYFCVVTLQKEGLSDKSENSDYVDVIVNELPPDTTENELIKNQPTGIEIYEDQTGEKLTVIPVAKTDLRGKYENGTVSVEWFQVKEGGDQSIGTGADLEITSSMLGTHKVYCVVTVTKDGQSTLTRKSNEVDVTVFKRVPTSFIKTQPQDIEYIIGETGKKLTVVPIDVNDLKNTKYEGGTISVKWYDDDTDLSVDGNELDVSGREIGVYTKFFCKVTITKDGQPTLTEDSVKPTVTVKAIPKTYTMTFGANGEWTKGTATGLSFTSDASFDKFDSVKVDGNKIAATNYSAEEGSTKITLTPTYLETLSTGTHSIEIVSSDGSASTDFTLKVVYTVTFNMNGHGTQVADQTIDSGNTVVKPADPSETGWTFEGWYQDATFSVAFDFDTPITTGTTIYAKWTKTTHTVYFNPVLGSLALFSSIVNYGDTVDKPVDPSAEGYRFTGWYTEQGCENEFNFDGSITEDIELFAGWVKTYKVSFNMNGHGTQVADQTIDSGNTVVKPADPSETGWTFEGWYQDATFSVAFDFDTAITADTTVYAKWTKHSDTTADSTTPQTEDSTTPQTEDSTVAQTGDSYHMFLWAALLFISGSVLVRVTLLGKKKRYSLNR